MGLAGVAGFVLTNRLIPNETRKLVEDLPVVERLNQYVEVDNVAFLQELRRAGFFSEPPPTPAAKGPAP